MSTETVTLDSHMNIRVNQAQHQRFANVCSKSNIDASAVIRSLMAEVVERGLEYDSETGAPTLKPRKLK